MMSCDLCGRSAACKQREIEGKEYDICDHCWHPLAEKLSGKGRPKELLEELEEYVEAEV